MPLWKCQVCGLVYEGPEPPDKCPKCGAPREDKFNQLTQQEEELVKRSRYTNYLHMKAYTLLKELLGVAEEGIKDNLDPGCLKIFSEEREFAIVTMQKIMAELETHVKKGKWN